MSTRFKDATTFLLTWAIVLLLIYMLSWTVGCLWSDDRLIGIEEQRLYREGLYPEIEDGSWLKPYADDAQLRRFWMNERAQMTTTEPLQ